MFDPKLGYDPEDRFITMPGFSLYEMSGLGEVRFKDTKVVVQHINVGGNKARHKHVRLLTEDGTPHLVNVVEKQYQIWEIEDARKAMKK